VSQNLLFNARQDGLVALLTRTPSDVVCLQEVTPAWAKRLEATLGATHPWRGVEPRHGAYGVAIYSRLPLARPTLLKDGRRVAGQCVALRLAGAETALCNVHLSSPAGIVARGKEWIAGFDANARVRTAQWRLLREHVAREYPSARALIVAGDFNTLDTEPLYRTIRGSLVDAFQVAGEGRGATFPTEPTSPVPLVRIDYVFASPELAPLEAEVLPQAGSDHRGLRVTLAVARAGPRGALE
jgi:endonuclease/exonuclease/phosphatase family metal-dependent hydrolase